MELDKKKVYLLVCLLIILVTLIIISYTKNCGHDSACFDKYVNKCSKAKVSIIKESGDEFRYEIMGPKADSCVITAYFTKANMETSLEVKKFLEGKGMICEVPNEELKQKSVKDINNLSDYCTGPLKEAILQISVEKLYSIVVKNIGQEAMASYNLIT